MIFFIRFLCFIGLVVIFEKFFDFDYLFKDMFIFRFLFLLCKFWIVFKILEFGVFYFMLGCFKDVFIVVFVFVNVRFFLLLKFKKVKFKCVS